MYTYQVESYYDVIDDLLPIVEKHAQEVDLYQESVKLSPDLPTYEVMNHTGMLHIYTARVEDTKELVGYVVTLVNKHPHYNEDTYAVNDLFYVHPDHRHQGVAEALLSGLEDIMRGIGVSVMTLHMKEHMKFESLMDHLEWDRAEIMYSKLIKES